MRNNSLSALACAFLLVSLTLVGCETDSGEAAPAKIEGLPPAIEGDDAVHVHPTVGPHGGHLIELGDEEYHAELLHDEDTHTVTIHLLDGTGKESVAFPLAEIALQLFEDGQFVKYTLTATTDPGGSADAASRFELVDAALCETLCHGEELRARLQLTIDGEAFTGTIDHVGHSED